MLWYVLIDRHAGEEVDRLVFRLCLSVAVLVGGVEMFSDVGDQLEGRWFV